MNIKNLAEDISANLEKDINAAGEEMSFPDLLRNRSLCRDLLDYGPHLPHSIKLMLCEFYRVYGVRIKEIATKLQDPGLYTSYIAQGHWRRALAVRMLESAEKDINSFSELAASASMFARRHDMEKKKREKNDS